MIKSLCAPGDIRAGSIVGFLLHSTTDFSQSIQCTITLVNIPNYLHQSLITPLLNMNTAIISVANSHSR